MFVVVIGLIAETVTDLLAIAESDGNVRDFAADVIVFDVEVETIVFTREVVEVIAFPEIALVVEVVTGDEDINVVTVVLLIGENDIAFVAAVVVAAAEPTLLVCKIFVEIGLLETVTVDVLEFIILDVVVLKVEFVSFFDSVLIEEIGLVGEMGLACETTNEGDDA